MRKITCLLLLVVAAVVVAQEPIQSGPQKGAKLPASFDPLNINGPHKNSQHCLITKFGLEPTVILIFAREPAEGKEAVLGEMLQKLDEYIAKIDDPHFLAGGVVFLSPHARNFTADAGDTDLATLLKESQAHEALVERLGNRAKDLKKLIVACYPEGPKKDGPDGYKIHEKAEVTVLVYRKLEVLANFPFTEGQLKSDDVDEFLKKVDKLLPKRKF